VNVRTRWALDYEKLLVVVGVGCFDARERDSAGDVSPLTPALSPSGRGSRS
jgi:hypothetical protein